MGRQWECSVGCVGCARARAFRVNVWFGEKAWVSGSGNRGWLVGTLESRGMIVTFYQRDESASKGSSGATMRRF